MVQYSAMLNTFIISLLVAQTLFNINLKAINDKEFVLITSLYNEKNNERAQEYLYCLNRNLHHPQIKKIHVIYDSSKDDDNNLLLNFLKQEPTIKLNIMVGRPNFSFLLDLANKLYSGKNIILSNADIYFDESLKLLTNYNLSGKFLSLTRWEALPNETLVPNFNYDNTGGPYGADTWIFISPIEKFKNCKFGLGILGCDGMLIYQAYKSNLTVLNPCVDIKCCHWHKSEIRNYELKYPKESMAWIRASSLKDEKSDIIIIQENNK